MNTYANKFRPVSFCTLPDNIDWQFTELPFGIDNGMGTPQSLIHRYGVIKTNRPLTKEECETFGYIAV